MQLCDYFTRKEMHGHFETQLLMAEIGQLRVVHPIPSVSNMFSVVGQVSYDDR